MSVEFECAGDHNEAPEAIESRAGGDAHAPGSSAAGAEIQARQHTGADGEAIDERLLGAEVGLLLLELRYVHHLPVEEAVAPRSGQRAVGGYESGCHESNPPGLSHGSAGGARARPPSGIPICAGGGPAAMMVS